MYVHKLDVLNRGFSGYNTDWALPLLKLLKQVRYTVYLCFSNQLVEQ